MRAPSTPLRTLFLALLATLTAACGGGGTGPGARPNVVLITLDTTRADYLSCYGFDEFELVTSPSMDRLAEEGTRFDLAISTAAVTPVSHASILTGRFNAEHGVRVISAGSGFRLDEAVPTLGEAFKHAGYATLAVHSAFPVSPYFGLTQGFDVVDSFDTEMETRTSDTGMEKAEWDQRNTRRSDATIERVIAALDRVEDPFFLWLHLWDPHDAIHVPEREFLPDEKYLFEHDAQGNVVFETDAEGRQVLDSNGSPKPVLQRPMKALYAAEIRYMDMQIGVLMDHLREQGRYDDTIVAITADHGQGLQDHGWAAHRILYQEQIRVPLILRLPGVEQPGSVQELVRTVDIAPTVLDYAGLPPLEGMSGRSLRALLEGQDDAPRITFAEQINGYDTNAGMVEKLPHDDFMYCAMDRQWKLTWRPNHPDQSELYDLERDPGETINLWRWHHPEALRLKRALAEYRPWVTAAFPDDASNEEAAGANDALRALGYVDGEEGDEDEGDSPAVVPDPDEEGLSAAERIDRIVWEFVCPEHRDQRLTEWGACPDCGSPMILIAQGK
jgi:arylsulfatase A-like enzyme